MKKVEHYICEVCGTEYAHKLDCSNCEKGHKKPVKIAGVRFLPLKNDRTGFPIDVIIEMEDGKTATFKRVS